MSKQGEPISTPADIDLSTGEAILLAWIEDELAPDRRAEVEQRLAGDPRLLASAKAMASDRTALRLLRDEPAPPGLLDSVADAIEREMLVGVTEDGQTLVDGPVPSLVRPPRAGRPSWLAPLIETRTGRRASALAAALLMLGVTGWMLTGVLNPRGNGLASDPRNPELGPTPNGLAQRGLSSGDPAGEVTIAMGDASPEESDLEAMASISGADGQDSSRLAGADASDPGAERNADITVALAPEPIDPGSDHAFSLLLQGRLAIRALTPSPDGALASLDALGANGRNARIRTQQPGQLLALLPESRPLPEVSRLEFARRQSPRAFASDGRQPSPPDGAQLPGAGRQPTTIPAPIPAPTRAVLAGARVVELDADRDRMRRVLERLTREIGEYELIELDAPAPPPTPGLDPDRLLWWRLEPARWTPTASIPVFIERYE